MFTRNHLTWRCTIALPIFIPLLIIFFLAVKNTVYFLSQFVFISNTTRTLQTCNKIEFNQHIPMTMHQIFGFKDLEMKTEHGIKRQAWTNAHRNYTHYLWNETAVTSLIRREYGHLYSLFQSYPSWVQRADVGRYVVMYHYGGWYVDIDIGCKNGIHEPAEEAYKLRKNVVLRRTLPVGTSNDIFGVTPQHPFLKAVLDHLYEANRWYLIPHWNVLLSAGSTYMWGRYLNYPCKNDILVLEEDQYKTYFVIEHDGSWHSWDTGTINTLHTFIRSQFSFGVSVLIIILSVTFYLLFRLLYTRLRNR